MDVVDLHDFVQLFRLPKKSKKRMTELSPSNKDTQDISSSSSSLTLPMSEHTTGPDVDIEKVATLRSGEAESSIQKVTTALDWTDVDDPENPENWSGGKKAYHIAYVGFQGFVITFGSSVYTPAIPEVARHFGISVETATLPLTMYVIGLAFGPIVSAPISETFGRRIVYLTLFPLSLLFGLGAAFAQSFATLVICRFLAGTIGSGALAIGAGTNSDLFASIKRAPVASVFLLAPFFGPALGPLAGGYLAETKGWRWTQYIILMVGAFVVVMGFFQKETYKKIILADRAKRLNLPPPPNPMATMTVGQKLKFILMITVTRPVNMLLTEPIVAFLAFYTAFNFGVLFIFFAAFPIVFESIYPEVQIYHFTTGQTGLVFIGIGIGLLFAAALFIFVDKRYYQPLALRQINEFGKDPRALLLPPEKRTLPAIVGSFCLPVSLFWFAWTARAGVHWIVPVIGSAFFGAGNILVFFTAVMYSLDTFGPMSGASAMAANGILRYIAGATFPLFARQMYRAMGVAWATSLLGFVTVALMPLPWVLMKYGPWLRSKSKYADYSKHI